MIYIRLSVYRGEADPTTSPASQEARCRAYAESKGWDVVDVVRDLDVSGSDKGLRLDRPGLASIRERFHDVDVVIFAKLDRLARNVLDFNRFAEEARTHDVDLVSVAESLDLSTPGGRFVAQILAAFAEMEAATIAERTKLGKETAVTKLGRYGGNTPPYGYRIVEHPSGRGSALEIDPEEAAHIREAARLVLDGGSLYGAAQMLNETGSKPHRAERWGWSTLRAVLVGDAVLGRVKHRGRLILGDDGLPEVRWEPIFTLEESQRLRAILARPSDLPKDSPARAVAEQEHTTRTRAARLLSGLLTCSGCGRPMRAGVFPRRGEKVGRYVCSAEGARCPAPVTITATLVEDYVAEVFLGMAGLMPVFEVRTMNRDAAEVAQVEQAIAETTDELRAPDADIAALVERLTILRQRRDELAAQPAEPEVVKVDTGEMMAARWEREDVAGRRALVHSVLTGPMTVHPGKRGPKRLDPDRLDIPWRWEDIDVDAEIADAARVD
ncbi:recombinase family protein [Georgenia yuyongxinii]|uniref:recombinase family protein n=1 Tax=Georgenia yuyongxinii TaxID=2589797 RepID=UPI00143D6E38|nr:recombinase family protein [Georgenia yuyongxinii]